MKILLLLLLPVTILLSSETASNHVELMIQDLESARYKFSSRYAMCEWKGEEFNWTLDHACEEAKTRVQTEIPTIKQYQNIFKNFLQSMQDYHVRAVFYSTSISCFPLHVKGANGHYYLTGDYSVAFDTEEISFPIEETEQEEVLNLFLLKAGDEVIALDGTPIREVIETLIDQDLGGDRSPTGYALAEKILFYRKGKYGMNPPSGTFEITVKHQGQTNLATYPFKWLHSKELIEDPLDKEALTARLNHPNAKKNTPTKSFKSLSSLLSKDYTVGFVKDLIRMEKKNQTEDEGEEDYDWREKGFLPPLGQILWESDPADDLYAYLYLNEKGQKIGYIYIPTFSIPGEQTAAEIVELIRRFEKDSQALVIDINDNPGGYLLYTYGILSMLTPYPMATLPERELLIQEDVYEAILMNSELREIEELTGTINGYPVNSETLNKIIGYNEDIIRSWNAGKRMTDQLYVLGIDTLFPHPEAHYSKPIVVLTNELDFSCADWFPAILQDNERAVIFGAKTAGAGGSVRAHPHLSQFGVRAITVTGSIGYRLDGTPIENRGVTPDVPYEITENDLKNDYCDYKKALNKTVEDLIR